MVQTKQTKKILDVSESSFCISSIFKGGFVSVGQRAVGGIISTSWLKGISASRTPLVWRETYVKIGIRSHHTEPHVQGCECLFATAQSQALAH